MNGDKNAITKSKNFLLQETIEEKVIISWEIVQDADGILYLIYTIKEEDGTLILTGQTTLSRFAGNVTGKNME